MATMLRGFPEAVPDSEQDRRSVPSSRNTTGSASSTPHSSHQQTPNAAHTPHSAAAEENGEGGSSSAAPRHSGSEGDGSASPSGMTVRVLRLHNLPRNWMHEEIIEFIDQVAAHAGIKPSPAAVEELRRREEEEAAATDDDDGSDAIPRATSPFVRHLFIPFGRRTGLVYGSPALHLTSSALASYLLKDLRFDPDDYRERIYFTEETDEMKGGETMAASSSSSAGAVPRVRFVDVEETVEHEQAEAMRTMELDRYLLAPDVLLDIAKMNQRRLVTRNEKVVLDAFRDGPEDAEAYMEEEKDDEQRARDGDGGEEVGAVDGNEDARPTPTTRRKNKAKSGKGESKLPRSRRAGKQRRLGRGSSLNMPIPKPYVLGRRL